LLLTAAQLLLTAAQLLLTAAQLLLRRRRRRRQLLRPPAVHLHILARCRLLLPITAVRPLLHPEAAVVLTWITGQLLLQTAGQLLPAAVGLPFAVEPEEESDDNDEEKRHEDESEDPSGIQLSTHHNVLLLAPKL
jgi:hypothetical protein